MGFGNLKKKKNLIQYDWLLNFNIPKGKVMVFLFYICTEREGMDIVQVISFQLNSFVGYQKMAYL